MDERFIIGTFGNMEFMYRPSSKKNYFNIWVTITDVDRNHVFIKDNHNHPFLVQKKDIKRWEVREKVGIM